VNHGKTFHDYSTIDIVLAVSMKCNKGTRNLQMLMRVTM